MWLNGVTRLLPPASPSSSLLRGRGIVSGTTLDSLDMSTPLIPDVYDVGSPRAREGTMREESALALETPAPDNSKGAVCRCVDGDALKSDSKDTLALEQFEVRLVRTAREPFGATFECKAVEGFPVVNVISSTGLLKTWNDRNSMQIKPSTYIVAANGKTDPGEILRECSTASRLTLQMERKTQYVVSLQAKGEVLGIDVKRGTGWVVGFTRPTDARPAYEMGVHQWNFLCAPGCEIRRGDQMMNANGKVGAALLPAIRALSASEPLELIMSRP